MQYKNLFLVGGSICLLWLLRVAITGSTHLGFIALNIFLASIPLLLEPVFAQAGHHLHGLVRKAARVLIGVAWLLFLPNAFYILTDFMHLNSDVLVNARNDSYSYVVHYSRGDGLYVFDSLLLFAAAAFGAYMGGLALLHAYNYLRRKLPKPYAHSVFGLIIFLSSIGVYIGRFSRWNSWQAVTQPVGIVSDLVHDLSIYYKRERFLLVILTIVLFEIASFAYVRYQQSKHHTQQS